MTEIDSRPDAFIVGQRVVVTDNVGTRFTHVDGCYGHIVSTYGPKGINPGMSTVKITGRIGKPVNMSWLNDDGSPNQFSNNDLEAAD